MKRDIFSSIALVAMLIVAFICLTWSTIRTQEIAEWKSAKYRRDRIRWMEDVAVNQYQVEREIQQNGRLPMGYR